MPFNKKETIFSNLSCLGDTRSTLMEKRLAHLGELAELLCDEADEEEIFFRDPGFAAKYKSLTAELETDLSEKAAPVNRERLGSVNHTLSVFERAFICRRLSDSLGIRGIQAAGTFFDDTASDDNETISYMRSSYADAAYTRFSGLLSDPKVMYGHDFSEVCENVYYGRCAYCILPVENTADGRLAGFRGLIMKYGLKTVMVCRVETAIEGESTVFALMKKNIALPTGNGRRFLEFRIRTEDGLSTLISAADACGMKPLSITSVPGDGYLYDMVLRVNEQGVCGLLSFLYLEYSDFTITGIFGEI